MDGWYLSILCRTGLLRDWRWLREVLAGPSTIQDAGAAYIQTLNCLRSWLHKKYFHDWQVYRQPRARGQGAGAADCQLELKTTNSSIRDGATPEEHWLGGLSAKRSVEGCWRMQLLREMLKRWRRDSTEEWERWSRIWCLCPCQIIIPHMNEKPAVEIKFSTFYPSHSRKSPHCRHTGTILSRSVSFSRQGFLFNSLRCWTWGK